ncbi:MAG: D-2-hydroxyacid dehydrogenase [Protaetiibacter sp.]
MTTVLTTRHYTEHVLDELRELFPEVAFARLGREGEIPPEAADATVLLRCVMSKPELSAVLAAVPTIRWIHSCTAGFDQLLVPEIEERGLLVTRSGESHHIQIAEWAIAGLMALAKQFPLALRAQAEHRWIGSGGWAQPVEFYGSTLGIIGAGAIGTEIAKRAQAFGMRVLGTKRTPDVLPGYDEVLGPDGLERLLRESDFVVVACPLTSETRGMLGAEQLAMMKPTAYISNIARGAIFDERALIAALESGAIAGAALDAFVTEPLPADDPIWTTRNVLVTPHASGRSAAAAVRAHEEFIANLRRFEAGEPLHHVLGDARLGY